MFPGGARVDAYFDGFVVRTDQPERSGGEGTAPTPFQLFLASIGTCAGIFIVGFCQQRNISTAGMCIRQHVYADPQTHMVTRVKLDVDLPPDFPAKYVQAVVRAAEQCTVKRHLLTPPQIEIEAHLLNDGQP